MDLMKKVSYEEYKVLMAIESSKNGLYKIWSDRCDGVMGLDEYCVRIMEKVVNTNLSYGMKADLYDFMMNLVCVSPSIIVEADNLRNHIHWNNERTLLRYLSYNNFSGYVDVFTTRDIKHMYYIYRDGTVRDLGIYNLEF